MNITEFLTEIFAPNPEVMYASVEPSDDREAEQVCKFIETLACSEFNCGRKLAAFLRKEYKAHRIWKLRIGREYSLVLYITPYVGKTPLNASKTTMNVLRAKSANQFYNRALRALGKGGKPNEHSIENVNVCRFWYD
jgi:hypothetical protein